AEGQRQPVGAEWGQEAAVHFRRGEGPPVSGLRVQGQYAVRVEVRTVASGAVPVRVNAGHDGEGLARLIGGDAGELPSAEDLPDRRGLRPGGFEPGDLVNVMRDEAVRAVEDRRALFRAVVQVVLRDLRRGGTEARDVQRLVVVAHVLAVRVREAELQPV